MTRSTLLLNLLLAIILVSGCEKKGLDGMNSLVQIDVEPVGENCAAGGYKISNGIDLNNDQVLNEDEVLSINFLCHGINGTDGMDGFSSLIRVLHETTSDYCPVGGYLIHSGIDFNMNDSLDDDEIQSTYYICHGSDMNLDKKIIIPFIGKTPVQGSSRSGTVSTQQMIRGFNINDYPEADSIVFGGFQWTLSTGIECIVQLFDLTNNRVIINTQIRRYAISDSAKWKSTNINFINNLPNENIDLGVFIKSSQEGERVYLAEPTLIIYRK